MSLDELHLKRKTSSHVEVGEDKPKEKSPGKFLFLNIIFKEKKTDETKESKGKSGEDKPDEPEERKNFSTILIFSAQ